MIFINYYKRIREKLKTHYVKQESYSNFSFLFFSLCFFLVVRNFFDFGIRVNAGVLFFFTLLSFLSPRFFTLRIIFQIVSAFLLKYKFLRFWIFLWIWFENISTKKYWSYFLMTFCSLLWCFSILNISIPVTVWGWMAFFIWIFLSFIFALYFKIRGTFLNHYNSDWSPYLLSWSIVDASILHFCEFFDFKGVPLRFDNHVSQFFPFISRFGYFGVSFPLNERFLPFLNPSPVFSQNDSLKLIVDPIRVSAFIFSVFFLILFVNQSIYQTIFEFYRMLLDIQELENQIDFLTGIIQDFRLKQISPDLWQNIDLHFRELETKKNSLITEFHEKKSGNPFFFFFEWIMEKKFKVSLKNFKD